MASGSVNYLYLALTAQSEHIHLLPLVVAWESLLIFYRDVRSLAAVNAVPAFVGNEYTAGVSTGLQRTSESAIVSSIESLRDQRPDKEVWGDSMIADPSLHHLLFLQWTVNVVTGAIAPVWTNPNGGQPSYIFLLKRFGASC